MNKNKEEKKEEDFDISDIPVEEDIIAYTNFMFSVATPVTIKGKTYNRVVIVNRWLWMTDDTALRKIYAPLRKELEQNGFKEFSPAILYTKRSVEECKKYFLECGIREDNIIGNSPLKHVK